MSAAFGMSGKTYSASKINLWKQCELRYCAENFLGFKSDELMSKNPKIQLGSLLHKYFENFYKDSLQPKLFKLKERKLSDLKDAFIVDWERISENLTFNLPFEKTHYADNGITALENFYKREESSGFRPPIMLEQSFKVDLGQFKLSGPIDRIDQDLDGKIKVIDYKISDNPKSCLEADIDDQLTIYHIACEQSLLKRAPKKINFYYPLQDLVIETSRNEEQLNTLLADVLEMDLLIQERGSDPKNYPATPTDWNCRFCPYREKCLAHKYEKIEAKEFDESAVKEKVQRLKELKSQIKALEEEFEPLKEEVKSLMIEKEIKDLGDCKLTKRKNTQYDVMKLWDFIRTLDNGYEFTKIDKTAIEDAMRDFSPKEQKLIKQALIKLEDNYSLTVRVK